MANPDADASLDNLHWSGKWTDGEGGRAPIHQDSYHTVMDDAGNKLTALGYELRDIFEKYCP